MTAAVGPSEASPTPLPDTPSVARRLAALVYEGVLLFGVVMLTGLVYGLLTNQRHALQGATGLQITLFVVLGTYFVYFWSRQGQTLAMRTWHIRLQTLEGHAPSPWRAGLRYLAAWMWFLPALATAHFSSLRGGGLATLLLIVGALVYASLALLRPDRQFWHDVLCGTRLVSHRPATPAQRP